MGGLGECEVEEGTTGTMCVVAVICGMGVFVFEAKRLLIDRLCVLLELSVNWDAEGVVVGVMVLILVTVLMLLVLKVLLLKELIEVVGGKLEEEKGEDVKFAVRVVKGEKFPLLPRPPALDRAALARTLAGTDWFEEAREAVSVLLAEIGVMWVAGAIVKGVEGTVGVMGAVAAAMLLKLYMLLENVAALSRVVDLPSEGLFVIPYLNIRFTSLEVMNPLPSIFLDLLGGDDCFIL